MSSLITTQRQLSADARRILWLFRPLAKTSFWTELLLFLCSVPRRLWATCSFWPVTASQDTHWLGPKRARWLRDAKQQRAKRGRGPDTYLIVICQTLRSAVNITHRLIKVSARGQCPSARQALQHLYSRHAHPRKRARRHTTMVGVAMTGAEGKTRISAPRSPAVSNPTAEPTIRAGSQPPCPSEHATHGPPAIASLSPSVPASRGSAARVEPTSAEKGYGAPKARLASPRCCGEGEGEGT
ncbi:hypothetical protein DFH11DRAFT_1663126 [Phellopilus nigrolimitatus]|nr:hypothetical protein DFH11DRAFT_1663126 [Phellopilus nigrolimitatus]